MKNNMIAVLKKCGSVVFSLLLIVCLFPVMVFGESSTYYTASAFECVEFIASNDSTVRHVFRSGNKETRCVILRDPVYHYYNLVFVSLDSSIRFTNSGSSSCPATYNDVQSRTFQGTTYYYQYITRQNLFSGNVVPYVEADFSISNSVFDLAFYYTYGAGAVEPVEPVDWGILKSPAYSTQIAGSGEASAANIDTVTWSLPYDTNNNDISESGVVDVRAVRGKWAGESAEALQGKDYTQFSLEQSGANLGTVPASQGSFTASWSNVMQALDMASLLLLLGHKVTGDTWEKDGWIYQIRLRVPDDDYTGEWQTVYTATSTSVTGSDTIINSTSYNMEVNQAFTEITQVNNNTSITYTYFDTDINIENPDAGTEPEGGTDLWDILKQIINGLYQILVKLGDIAKSISNVVSNLLDGLFDIIRDLFLHQEVDEEVTINFNDRMQEIKGRSGLFGEALDFERQLYNQLFGISEPEPVITWPDLTYDDVTYIQGGSINLKDFIDHEGASSTYAFFRTLISGAIYYLLFLNILKKLKEVINK